MKKAAKPVADYIKPLNMDGMEGRVLKLPAPTNKTREILLIYGHHASIERMQGVAEELNKYGSVTLPDLPGFGGMDSFYSVGEKPHLDALADYLAAFVKMRYRRRRFTIIAMSFGFVVATRMLQKYPDLASKVDLVVSIVGFVHKDAFVFKRTNYNLMRFGTVILSFAFPAALVQHIALRPVFIRAAYRLVANKHVKLYDADEAERDKRIEFEVTLWRINDVRTYMHTARTMFNLDLIGASVDLPVYHVAVEPDRYFNNAVVEQHLHTIYSDVEVVHSKMKGHAPTVVATAKEAAPFIPPKIRRLLAQK